MASTISIQVLQSGPEGSPIRVRFTRSGSAQDLSASKSFDWILIPIPDGFGGGAGQLQFSSNTNVVDVEYATRDDNFPEPSRDIEVRVRRHGETNFDNPVASTTFTFNDNDTSTTYVLSPASVRVTETAGTVSFTVTRSGPLRDEWVSVWTTNTLGYENNSDYGHMNGTQFHLTAVQQQFTFSVSINTDAETESEETFGIEITSAYAGVGDGNGTYQLAARGNFTILDNNGGSRTVTLTGPGIVDEDQVGASNTLTFTLTRTGDLQHAEDIDWTFTGISGGGANPLDFLSMANGGTYVGPVGPGGEPNFPATGTVHFDIGSNVATVVIPIKGDTRPELNDQFRLTITARDPNTTISTSSVDATIFNDDGIRNADTLIYWAVNHSPHLPEQFIPSTAHGLLNAERNYNSDDHDLLLASRYLYGAKFGIESLLGSNGTDGWGAGAGRRGQVNAFLGLTVGETFFR